MNEWQQFEVDEFEKEILIRLFGQITIPDKTANLLKVLRIDINNIIKSFENKVIVVMNDDGRINSSRLKGCISIWKPQLLKSIDIPEVDFRLVDMVDEIFELLRGRK